MILKLNEKKDISTIPMKQSMVENTANRLERMKKNRADTKIIRKPGSSLGSSRKVLWKLFSENVSLRKLLNVEFTTLSPKPTAAIVPRNSPMSLVIDLNRLIIPDY
jgi:hypothetical protein